MSKIPPLSILLPSILVAWLVGCVAVHGFAIFAYLAMHAVTTGIFVTLMFRAERQLSKKQASAAASVRPATATPNQATTPADRKAAVA